MYRAGVVPFALLGVLAVASCRIEHAPLGRPGEPVAASASDSVASAEVYAALRLFYARLTSRDWKVLAESFWPRATITTIMRPTADSAERVHTIAIEEFVVLASRHGIRDCPVSFSDEMARANVVTYGPLADAWVTYRARCGVTRDSTATHYGMDAFHLMKHRGEWRVAGLTFTMEIPDQPLSRTP